MLDTFRVLGAALALREFSAEDVATFTGISADDVEGVVRAQANHFEPISGGGSAPPRWRLISEPHEIDAELRTIFEQLSEPPLDFPAERPEDAEVALQTAEYAIRETFVRSDQQRRREESLALAQTALQGAKRHLALVQGTRKRTDVTYRVRYAVLSRLVKRIVHERLDEGAVLKALAFGEAIAGNRQPTEASAAPQPPIRQVKGIGRSQRFADMVDERVYLLRSSVIQGEKKGLGTDPFRGVARSVRLAAKDIGVSVEERGGWTRITIEKQGSTAVLMVDSSRDTISHVEEFVEANKPETTVVLDLEYSDHFRNAALGSKLIYQPNAKGLDSKAITGLLGALGVGMKARLRDSETLNFRGKLVRKKRDGRIVTRRRA